MEEKMKAQKTVIGTLKSLIFLLFFIGANHLSFEFRNISSYFDFNVHFFYVFLFWVLALFVSQWVSSKFGLLEGRETSFGFKGWLSNIVDWILISIIAWKIGFQYFKSSDSLVMPSLLTNLFFVYYFFSLILFKKTIGMKLLGLTTVGDSKFEFFKLSVVLSLAAFYFRFWFLAMMVYFLFIRVFLKSEKSFLEAIVKVKLLEHSRESKIKV